MASSTDHRDSFDDGQRAYRRQPSRAGDAALPSVPQPASPGEASFHISTGPTPYRAGPTSGDARANTVALVYVIGGRVAEPAGGAGRVLESGAVALFDGAWPPRPWLADGPVLTVPLECPVPSGHGWPDGRRDVLVLPRAGTDVLRDMLRSLAHHAAGLTARQAMTAAATIGALLRDALDGEAGGPAAALPAHQPDKVRQILAFIDAHSSRVDLSPEMIAAATGVSRSVLYRLLEAVGGVAACVKRRRLDAMRRALGQRNDRRSIAEIAADSGFLNPSHAHRNFREAFGVTPGDYRRDGLILSGNAADPPPAGRRAHRRSAGCSG